MRIPFVLNEVMRIVNSESNYRVYAYIVKHNYSIFLNLIRTSFCRFLKRKKS
jgi:hypothetical protein